MKASFKKTLTLLLIAFLAGCASSDDSNYPGVNVKQLKNQIRSEVAEGKPRIQECYRKSLDGNPNLEGQVTYIFRVDDKGDLNAVRIDRERSTLDDLVLSRCIESVFQNVDFPKAPQNSVLEITYPFIFSAEGKKASKQP